MKKSTFDKLIIPWVILMVFLTIMLFVTSGCHQPTRPSLDGVNVHNAIYHSQEENENDGVRVLVEGTHKL